MNHEELKAELVKLGVTILGSGLGPCYTYKGIEIGGGIDNPTTLEKHWSIKQNGKLGISIYPYRKKYIRSVEMIDGKPVKKFTKEEYKEYDEYNNPHEFIEGVKETISELEKVLPKLTARLALHINNHLKSIAKNDVYYITHELFTINKNGKYDYRSCTGYFGNGSRYFILSENPRSFIVKIVQLDKHRMFYFIDKKNLAIQCKISSENFIQLAELNNNLGVGIYE